jgi:hypothetical protein
MRVVLYALLALPATVFACDTYEYCHCYDKNTVPNDAATMDACFKITGIDLAVEPVGPRGSLECTFTGVQDHLVKVKGLGNCRFRKLCEEAGATGGDSSCRQKVEITDD